MRIYSPLERGLCFDWADQCTPRRGRNVKERRDWGVCGGCQSLQKEGWQLRGTMGGYWS